MSSGTTKKFKPGDRVKLVMSAPDHGPVIWDGYTGTVTDGIINGWEYAVLIDQYHADENDSFGFNECELEAL